MKRKRQSMSAPENKLSLIKTIKIPHASLDLLTDELNQIIDSVLQLTQAERGFIMLFDENEKLEVRVIRNITHEALENDWKEFSRGIIEKALKDGTSILTINAQDDPRFAQLSSVKNFLLRSVLVTPLRVRGEMIGVLYLDNKMKAGAFKDADLALLKMVAPRIATSIKNTFLYQEVRGYYEQSKTLNNQFVQQQELERARLSYELHEHIAQTIAAMQFSLHNIKGDLPAQFVTSHQDIKELLETITTLTQQLRLLATDLRPPTLNILDIAKILEDFCDDFSQQHQLSIEFKHTSLPPLAEESSLALYRFTQQTLELICEQHKPAMIQIYLKQQADEIILAITDPTPEYATDETTSSALAQIQQRLDALGGSLNLNNLPTGICFAAHVPLKI